MSQNETCNSISQKQIFDVGSNPPWPVSSHLVIFCGSHSIAKKNMHPCHRQIYGWKIVMAVVNEIPFLEKIGSKIAMGFSNSSFWSCYPNGERLTTYRNVLKFQENKHKSHVYGELKSFLKCLNPWWSMSMLKTSPFKDRLVRKKTGLPFAGKRPAGCLGRSIAGFPTGQQLKWLSDWSGSTLEGSKSEWFFHFSQQNTWLLFVIRNADDPDSRRIFPMSKERDFSFLCFPRNWHQEKYPLSKHTYLLLQCR